MERTWRRATSTRLLSAARVAKARTFPRALSPREVRPGGPARTGRMPLLRRRRTRLALPARTARTLGRVRLPPAVLLGRRGLRARMPQPEQLRRAPLPAIWGHTDKTRLRPRQAPRLVQPVLRAPTRQYEPSARREQATSARTVRTPSYHMASSPRALPARTARMLHPARLPHRALAERERMGRTRRRAQSIRPLSAVLARRDNARRPGRSTRRAVVDLARAARTSLRLAQPRRPHARGSIGFRIGH
jgi:hypothetical protein